MHEIQVTTDYSNDRLVSILERLPIDILRRRVGRQHDLGVNNSIFVVVVFDLPVVPAEQCFTGLIIRRRDSGFVGVAPDDGDIET